MRNFIPIGRKNKLRTMLSSTTYEQIVPEANIYQTCAHNCIKMYAALWSSREQVICWRNESFSAQLEKSLTFDSTSCISGKYFTHTCQPLLKNLSHTSTWQSHSCFPQLFMHTFITCKTYYMLFVCITLLFVTTFFGCTGSSLKARSMHYRPGPLRSLVGYALH